MQILRHGNKSLKLKKIHVFTIKIFRFLVDNQEDKFTLLTLGGLMKKTAFFAIAVLSAFSAFADNFSTGFTPAGNVSSYTKTNYSVTSKFGEYFRSVSEKEIHKFSKGLETEFSLLNAKDELITKTTYVYDAKKLEGFTYSDIASSAELKTEYEYGVDSKIKSYTVTESDSGNLSSKTIYKYEGKKVTQSNYDKDGKLYMRIIQTLDDDGIPVQETEYNGDGTFSLSRSYSFTESKKISAIETFDEEGNCINKVAFRYDANDFLTEIQVYENGKIKERRIYKNDALGNPVRISYYDVAEKFGTTVNELSRIEDFSYTY